MSASTRQTKPEKLSREPLSPGGMTSPTASSPSTSPGLTEHNTTAPPDNDSTSMLADDASHSAGEQTEKEKPSTTRRALRLLSSLAVLTVLVGAGYWGHETGWRLPKWSALVGANDHGSVPWCEEHNVAEADCIACRTSLLPLETNYGWCGAHGLDPCPLCHPDIVQLSEPPQISDVELSRVDAALALRPRPENVGGCPLNARRVQFASTDTVKKAGIDVMPVERHMITESIGSVGEITYDDTRLARLSSRVPGTVWRVEKNVGDRVRQGDVLALVDAAPVGAAKSELLDALADVEFKQNNTERLRPLAEKQIIPESRMLKAETELEQAQIKLKRAQQSLANLGLPVSLGALQKLPAEERTAKLQFLGVPAALRQELGDATTSNLLPVVASLSGTVIRRDAVAGEVVSTEKVLFQLADTSRMWLVFNVSLEQADNLRLGQTVRFRPDGSKQVVEGKISWISTDVDPHTRTVAVRADLDNSDGRLRSETFGEGQVVLREDSQAIVVPNEAVQSDGTCHVVFVRDKNYFKEGSPKIFHTRTVRPGVKQDGMTEIIAGVWPGEVVVTKGSGVLRSQILKNQLGAGCTCGH